MPRRKNLLRSCHFFGTDGGREPASTPPARRVQGTMSSDCASPGKQVDVDVSDSGSDEEGPRTTMSQPARAGQPHSLLFEPFRAIGVVVDETPAVTHRLGVHTFVTTSIGRAWQTFRCDKLSLSLVSPPVQRPIRCVARLRACAAGRLPNATERRFAPAVPWRALVMSRTLRPVPKFWHGAV